MRKQNNSRFGGAGEKKYSDKLSRYRNDVKEFSEKFGGVKQSKKGFKKPITRKEKRKFERQLKHAKNLAFNKKEKMPTLDDLIQVRKKSKTSKLVTEAGVEDRKEEVTKTAKSEKKANTKQVKQEKKPKIANNNNNNNTNNEIAKLNTVELVESKLMNEEKKKKKYEKMSQKSQKQKLLEDNEQEDKEISRLEKLLHIKKGSKKYKQVFYDEGFSDLLDFCDVEKRKEIVKAESNMWLGGESTELNEEDGKQLKKKEIKINNKEKGEDSNSDQSESEIEDQDYDDEEENEGEEDENEISEDENQNEEDMNENEMSEDQDENESENDQEMSDEYEDELNSEKEEKLPKGLKEDIYGRIVDKKGNIVKNEKYIPPAQRLQQLLAKSSGSQESSLKLAKLSKQINGLLNRLSTSNMHSICNQIIQMFNSNQFTRYDLIETIYNLFKNSLIQPGQLTPIRLLVEHAALVCILSANIGIELGASLLQKFCMLINEYLNKSSDSSYLIVENKTLDNLILLICNLYNFKLFSASLLIDLLSSQLVHKLNDIEQTEFEKLIDLILIIFKCVGLTLRKDNPLMLKDLIVNLQAKLNQFKSVNESINNRLKFMLESINAIKNNDIRKLDAYDQEPVELIRKQAKVLFKEDQTNQLNISFKDLINANELGRWWIVGSAWSVEQQQNEVESQQKLNISGEEGGYSEKILKLAKQQHMNTDIRRAIFCSIVSAEDYTDAFMKLIKLSLKKQQEREIIYVIMHCGLNENAYNPYYSYLMQKFCQYDRRFKMTLTFHTWDKLKMLSEMNKQQIFNLAALISHLICAGCVTLSILKNVEFGEMNKYMLQFLTDLLKKIFMEQTDQRFQEIFLKISAIGKLSQLRNALKLFISHFILTDKGKQVEIDVKLKSKCELAQKYLSINSND